MAGGRSAASAVFPSADRRARFLLFGISSAIATLVSLPLLYLLVRASERGLSGYFDIVATSRTAGLLLQTLLLVVSVMVVALLLAVPAAWLVARTDLPGRNLWAVLFALPLVFPSYVGAFAFVSFLGPRGVLQKLLQPAGVSLLPELAYGFSGALLTLSAFSFPYIYLLLVPALRTLDPGLEESSRTLGSGAVKTFFTIVLPQLRRPLASGTLLVILYTLSDFGAVSVVRYETFTVSIYDAYRGLFDRAVAATLGTVLVLLTLSFIALEWTLVRTTRVNRSVAVRPAGRMRLAGFQYVALIFSALVVTVGFLIPSGSIMVWGLSALRGSSILPAVAGPFVSSVGAAILTALVSMLLSLPVAYLSVRHRSAIAVLLERICYAGFALPGLIVALSLVFFATRALPFIYQTFTLLIGAYVIRFLPEAIAASAAAIASVSTRLEEAGRSLGRTSHEVFRRITFPLLRSGLMAGGGLVFLTTMKELPATLILRPTGYESLATQIWTATAEADYRQAALPAFLLVLASGIPLYLLVIKPALRSVR